MYVVCIDPVLSSSTIIGLKEERSANQEGFNKARNMEHPLATQSVHNSCNNNDLFLKLQKVHLKY